MTTENNNNESKKPEIEASSHQKAISVFNFSETEAEPLQALHNFNITHEKMPRCGCPYIHAKLPAYDRDRELAYQGYSGLPNEHFADFAQSLRDLCRHLAGEYGPPDACSEEDKQLVQDALAALPRRQRQALELRFQIPQEHSYGRKSLEYLFSKENEKPDNVMAYREVARQMGPEFNERYARQCVEAGIKSLCKSLGLRTDKATSPNRNDVSASK